MVADTSPRVHVCVLCSTPVRSRRRRAGNAMKPRRRNGRRPKPELKSWLHLLPTQVQKPETEGLSADTLQQKVSKCWRGLRSIAAFAFQTSIPLASASLASSTWWALWTAHYTTTFTEVSLFLCLFPRLHVLITFSEIPEPICFLFCRIDVR